MNFTIFQLWTEQYRLLANLTWPNKTNYAERHGYKTIGVQHKVRSSIVLERALQWAFTLDAMPDGDFLLMVGTDTIITRPDTRLEIFVDNNHDLFVLTDGYTVFGDALIVRSCPATRRFLFMVGERGHKYAKHVGSEQDAMTVILLDEPEIPKEEHSTAMIEAQLNKTDVRVKVLNDRKFCFDDIANHDSRGIPRLGQNRFFPRERTWMPEYFMVHLGGMPLTKRIELARNYL